MRANEGGKRLTCHLCTRLKHCTLLCSVCRYPGSCGWPPEPPGGLHFGPNQEAED